MIKEILLVHHTHTDWGYTTHGSQIEDLHCKIIAQAVNLCRQNANNETERRFRWTCESALIVEHYLKSCNLRQKTQFIELVNQNLIEVTAAPLTPFPHCNKNFVRVAMNTVLRLNRDYGIKPRVAMFADINGLSWFWNDELIRVGVKYLSMAMNFFCGNGMPRYTPFFWVGQKEKKLLTWHGNHYNAGAYWGLNHYEFDMNEVVPLRLAELREFPYEKFMLQVTNIPSDNVGPHPRMLDFIEKYNQLAKINNWPSMRMATLNEWFKYLEGKRKNFADLKGDWSDWWSSALPTMPIEIAAFRETSRRINFAEQWVKKLQKLDIKKAASFSDQIDILKNQLFFISEHVIGSSEAVKKPYSFAARAGESYKRDKIYSSLYSITKTLKEIIGIYCKEKHFYAKVFDSQLPETYDPNWESMLIKSSKNNTPNLCSKTGSKPQLADSSKSIKQFNNKSWKYLSNNSMCLGLNSERGIWSLKMIDDKSKDFFGKSLDGKFGQVVIEYPADNSRNTWFDASRGYSATSQLKTNNWPQKAKWLRQTLQPCTRKEIDITKKNESCISLNLNLAGGKNNQVQAITQMSLDAHLPVINIQYNIKMPVTVEPMAIYILFPLTLQPNELKADIGGAWIKPVIEQLPNSCLNWLFVDEGIFVKDKRNEYTVLWTPWDTPITMFETICPNPPKKSEIIKNAHIVSWAAHNYWTTNCGAELGGEYCFRYQLSFWKNTIDDKAVKQYISNRMCSYAISLFDKR